MRRLIQIRRRRGAVDPITAAYDRILATDPTVPLLFRLTSYRGQQVLFQDSSAVIDLESEGQPNGGVRHPTTGDIVSTQSTDVERPVWNGNGIDLDGTQSLDADPHPVICTIFCAVSVQSAERRNCLFASQSSASADSAGVTIELNAGFDESTIRVLFADGASRVLRNIDVSSVIPGWTIPINERFVVSVSISANQFRFFIDQHLVLTISHSLNLADLSSNPTRIGTNPYNGPVPMIGEYAACIIDHSVRSDEEIAFIAGELLK